ncbi:hypothetical protein CPB85DRAFT_1259540 [Mucidula mucida]|nr:hypothetical protein CPB85DRAFT_1259540 [Mucidula mucida]
MTITSHNALTVHEQILRDRQGLNMVLEQLKKEQEQWESDRWPDLGVSGCQSPEHLGATPKFDYVQLEIWVVIELTCATPKCDTERQHESNQDGEISCMSHVMKRVGGDGDAARMECVMPPTQVLVPPRRSFPGIGYNTQVWHLGAHVGVIFGCIRCFGDWNPEIPNLGYLVSECFTDRQGLSVVEVIVWVCTLGGGVSRMVTESVCMLGFGVVERIVRPLWKQYEPFLRDLASREPNVCGDCVPKRPEPAAYELINGNVDLEHAFDNPSTPSNVSNLNHRSFTNQWLPSTLFLTLNYHLPCLLRRSNRLPRLREPKVSKNGRTIIKTRHYNCYSPFMPSERCSKASTGDRPLNKPHQSLGRGSRREATRLGRAAKGSGRATKGSAKHDNAHIRITVHSKFKLSPLAL